MPGFVGHLITVSFQTVTSGFRLQKVALILVYHDVMRHLLASVACMCAWIYTYCLRSGQP